MTGRPSIYSEALSDTICERLADGESLRAICCDEEMPSQRAVIGWLAKGDYEPEKYPEFAEFVRKYTRARELQADTLADEILDISDNAANDWMEKFGDQGENIGWKENHEAVQRSRLRIDSRKWLAGKLRPKKYGESQRHEHTGKDGGAIEIEQRVREDADAVASAIAGLAERARAARVASDTQP